MMNRLMHTEQVDLLKVEVHPKRAAMGPRLRPLATAEFWRQSPATTCVE